MLLKSLTKMVKGYIIVISDTTVDLQIGLVNH